VLAVPGRGRPAAHDLLDVQQTRNLGGAVSP
jgi:hypothetical protein